MPNFRKSPLRTAVLLGCLLSFFAVEAQVAVPFTVRYQETLKGDMTMIANNIVNRQTSAGWFTPATTPNDPYSGNTANDNSTMRYIDIDSDGSTFSSSSATLTIDDISCSTIVYAGLYWSATYRYNGSNSGSGRATDFNVI